MVIMVSNLFTSCSATINQAVFNRQSKTKMLVGLSNRIGLEQDPFAVWFNKEYAAYAINKEAIQVIKNDSENLSIKIFMATMLY